MHASTRSIIPGAAARIFSRSTCAWTTKSFSHVAANLAVPAARAPTAGNFRAFSALPDRHGTTILCVRKDGIVCMAGDGQVSLSHTVVKGNAKKVRRIGDNILVGFAGSTADALTLLERLEKKLEEYPGQLTRACVELAKAWRTDKYLRKLEAALLVADANNIFELTGNGDVLEPESGVMSVGSGGAYALSAALALLDVPGMSAEQIVRKSMKIAGDICVYTNHNLTLETIKATVPVVPSDSSSGTTTKN